MTHYYSPYTMELVLTETPSDWMGQTDAPPPAFDAQTQSAFYKDDKWEIVTAYTPPIVPPTPQEQIQTLEAEQLLPRVVREFMLVSLETTCAAQDVDPNILPAYQKLKAFNTQISLLRDQIK
jgi:hypothetical protein